MKRIDEETKAALRELGMTDEEIEALTSKRKSIDVGGDGWLIVTVQA